MKKKYLLHGNEEIAEKRVSFINEIMVNPLNKLISKIQDAGGVISSLEDINNVLNNGSDAIDALIPPIDNGAIPPSLISVAEKERQGKINAIWDAYSAISNLPDDVSLSMLEMDASGCVAISPAAKEQIQEECKEYIKTPIGCELYEIQHELAELMQRFHDKLDEALNIPGKTMNVGAKAALHTLFPLSAFRFKHNDDDKIIVTPKTINFDPLNIDEA